MVVAVAGGLDDKPTVPPDVAVLNFDWKYAGYERAETVKQNETIPSTDASTSYKISRKQIYVFKYTAKATLKNTGAKTIKAVWWDHIFTDLKEQKELKRYSLQSRQQIVPGETQTLAREVGIDPKDNTRFITTGKQTVEITKIEYTDGSVWRQKQ
jgi:hypothetical protein